MAIAQIIIMKLAKKMVTVKLWQDGQAEQKPVRIIEHWQKLSFADLAFFRFKRF